MGSDNRVAWIICPGESLHFPDFPPEDLVICVNLALWYAPTRCNFWAAMDQPKDLHRACEAAYDDLRPDILHYGKHSKNKESWERYVEGRSTVFYEDLEPEWVRKAFGRSDQTIVLALSFCVSCGFEDIRLIGCDMNGVGYANGGPPVDIANDPVQWEYRWDYERKGLLAVQKAAKKKGIAITHVKP